MLKKAGIIVAVAAAGVLAVAPLAFAGDKGDWGHGHDGHGASAGPAPTCTFTNAADNSGNKQAASGVASPLLGILGTAANANAPVSPQTNAPIGSCNNLSDLVDINSNNKTKTVDNSKDINNSKDITKSRSQSSNVFSSLTGFFG